MVKMDDVIPKRKKRAIFQNQECRFYALCKVSKMACGHKTAKNKPFSPICVHTQTIIATPFKTPCFLNHQKSPCPRNKSIKENDTWPLFWRFFNSPQTHFLIPGFSCPVEPFSSSEAVKSGIDLSFIHCKFIRKLVITNNIVIHGYYSKLTLFKHLSKSHQGLYPYNPARSQQYSNISMGYLWV